MMVGAVDNDNNIADFSQYPRCTKGLLFNKKDDNQTCVEISAGGVNTLSTDPEGMATPAVAGIAALVWSNNNQCSGGEIRNALIKSAFYPRTDLSSHDVYFGYGIVQAAAASQYLTHNPCTGEVLL